VHRMFEGSIGSRNFIIFFIQYSFFF
jgi:hypothetical protein